jgi:hypothetical protein
VRLEPVDVVNLLSALSRRVSEPGCKCDDASLGDSGIDDQEQTRYGHEPEERSRGHVCTPSYRKPSAVSSTVAMTRGRADRHINQSHRRRILF